MNKQIPAMPKTSVVGSFLPGDRNEAKYSLLHTGHKDDIYVHIALNRLCTQSGFYKILKGSHLSRHPGMTPVSDWSEADIDLKEGDAIIWRCDLAYFVSSGGGGKSRPSSYCGIGADLTWTYRSMAGHDLRLGDRPDRSDERLRT